MTTTNINNSTNGTTFTGCSPQFFACYRIGNQGGSRSAATLEQAVEWVVDMTRSNMSNGKNPRVTWTVKDMMSKDTVYESATTMAAFKSSYKSNCTIDSDNYIQTNIKKEKKMNEKTTTASDKNFLMLSEDEVRQMAKRVMAGATEYLLADDEEFDAAIERASCGMVAIRKSHNTNRLSFKAWSLFNSTHNKKHPGSYNYDRVEDVICDTYNLGRKAFGINEKIPEAQNEADTGHINGEAAENKMTASEFVRKIIANVMVFLWADQNTSEYLQAKGCSLRDDIERLTNKVISCDIHDGGIYFKSATGISEVVQTSGLRKDESEQTFRTVIVRLLTNAAIAPATHKIIGSVVDLDDFAQTSWKMERKETEITTGDAPCLTDSDSNCDVLAGDVSYHLETSQHDIAGKQSPLRHSSQISDNCRTHTDKCRPSGHNMRQHLKSRSTVKDIAVRSSNQCLFYNDS